MLHGENFQTNRYVNVNRENIEKTKHLFANEELEKGLTERQKEVRRKDLAYHSLRVFSCDYLDFNPYDKNSLIK